MKPTQPYHDELKSSLSGLKIDFSPILWEGCCRVYEEELKKIDENNLARHAIARHYAKRWLELHIQLDELKKAFRNG